MMCVILLALFVLFFVMKKNHAQQEEKIVTVDLNGVATEQSSLPAIANADFTLDDEHLPSLTMSPSQVGGTTAMATLTFGAPPEKIESVSPDQANDNKLPLSDRVASVSVYDGVVRFYFAFDKANVADGSRNALDRLINDAKGRRYLVIAPIYEEAEKPLLDHKLLQQQVLNIWKILEDAGVSPEKRIILKPQAQEPGDDNYAAGVHIDVFTVQGDHYPAEDLWPISVPKQ